MAAFIQAEVLTPENSVDTSCRVAEAETCSRSQWTKRSRIE